MWGKWLGGVRVAVFDDEDRILMVSQVHEGREIWLLPGGAVEDKENTKEAGAREVLEETGLEVEILDLIWHMEEVSPVRGQRFVNYFMAKIVGGSLTLGKDPELEEADQVLRQVKFVTREEMNDLPNLHPPFIKDQIWDILKKYQENESTSHKIFIKREFVKA